MSLEFTTSFLKSLVVGFDPASILNLGLFLAACSTFFHYARAFVYGIARNYCISSVEMEGIDPVFRYLVRWMTVHQVKLTSKTVKATAVPQNTVEDFEESPLFRDDGLKVGREGPVNYRGADKLPIRFLPAGQYIFWHRGNRFVFQQSTRKAQQESDLKDFNEIIKLDCWGQSLKPIRDLLLEAQAEALDMAGSGTRVFRSASSSGGSFEWQHITYRPARSLGSVIMEETKKQALIDDMNEYLLSTTRKWYAAHGIPYRRGYLFSGKPGTGKTSLAFALAGVFGLSIYSISLADPDMVESELVGLFSTLPRRCIVLLEDIDAAGLKRSEFGGEKPTQDHVITRKSGGRSDSNSRRSLSLSGLLNTIDGVSSQEGRVLIMTTNMPEALDTALIRPGRVDMRIHFELANREQIRELFCVMYHDHKGNSTTDSSSVAAGDTKSSLQALADDFAAALPPDRLSLAAVQGHLLHYKHDPKKAVLNAESWCKMMLEEASSHAKMRNISEGGQNSYITINGQDV